MRVSHKIVQVVIGGLRNCATPQYHFEEEAESTNLDNALITSCDSL
jgi:hypothetical protein